MSKISEQILPVRNIFYFLH